MAPPRSLLFVFRAILFQLDFNVSRLVVSIARLTPEEARRPFRIGKLGKERAFVCFSKFVVTRLLQIIFDSERIRLALVLASNQLRHVEQRF